jgi:DNA processing protein
LGCGIDKIYTDPKGKLYPRIIEQGAILSEEWIGTEPIADNFPKRNRIISGLSKGVLIVESDFKGGALITANYALDQNRDVFAVPGSIFSHKSNGTNALIRDSRAKLALSPDDVLNDVRGIPKSQAKAETKTERTLPTFSGDESKVFEAILDEPTHIDAIADSTGLDVTDVLVILFELEFKSCIRQLPGKFFQKVA